MALRALLFSKDADTTAALAAVFAECGIIVESCADIFGAVQKGTKQPFACVMVDWSEQPEAGFLLRRARESEANRSTVPIAIVDDEPPPEQLRDHRLDFLFYRPIVADEARSVLAKARQKMEMQSSAVATESQIARSGSGASSAELDDPNLVAVTAKLPERSKAQAQSALPDQPDVDSAEMSETDTASEEEQSAESPVREHRRLNPRAAAAVLLILIVAISFWRSRAAFIYLKTTPEGTLHVLRESVKSLFYANGSGAQPVNAVMTEAQQDAYFSRSPVADKNSQPTDVEVVNAEASLPDTRHLPKPYDFPLPTPEFVHPALAPVRTGGTHIPESLRNSAPIAAPVVVTVGPSQMMPVSAPAPPSQPQQFSEPVPISEDAARALAIHTVSPVYPPEAQAQKLQGSVVLQAIIGRDGNVQDLKIVRGYFLLGKAAIAAVKQWQFKPYTVNGRPAATQTSITLKFAPPA